MQEIKFSKAFTKDSEKIYIYQFNFDLIQEIIKLRENHIA